MAFGDGRDGNSLGRLRGGGCGRDGGSGSGSGGNLETGLHLRREIVAHRRRRRADLVVCICICICACTCCGRGALGGRGERRLCLRCDPGCDRRLRDAQDLGERRCIRRRELFRGAEFSTMAVREGVRGVSHFPAITVFRTPHAIRLGGFDDFAGRNDDTGNPAPTGAEGGSTSDGTPPYEIRALAWAASFSFRFCSFLNRFRSSLPTSSTGTLSSSCPSCTWSSTARTNPSGTIETLPGASSSPPEVFSRLSISS